MKQQKLTILLATYNGEKYLREQLDSLIAQTYKEWMLLAHDDGSTDETLRILRSYANKDARIQLLEDGISGLGAAQNFLHLLKQAPDADLIMFCDQDDIWLPNKIEVMLQSIVSIPSPCMSYCNAYSYKNNTTLPEKLIMFHATNLKDTLFLNGGIHGCLQIINKPLRDIVVGYGGYVCMHDHLITLAAVSFGRVQYVDEALMYYRQHNANVTLGYETNVFRKIKNFWRADKAVIDTNHYKAIADFYKHYKEMLDVKQKEILADYLKFANSPLWKRIIILLKQQFKIGRTNHILLLKTLLRKPIGHK